MSCHRITVLLFAAFLAGGAGLRAEIEDSVGVIVPDQQYGGKVAWATRIDFAPNIDGYPDDSCWTFALPISDFIQRNPEEGEEPTEETVVRIVYDDQSIYFCFICYDSDPQNIQARLTPRDFIESSDNVRIYIDSFFDRRTAFEFTVNAVNVQADVLYTEDTRADYSWNSVWFSSVKVLDYGWVAEIEIPLSCLRYGIRPFQTWGLNLSRYIVRKREQIQWRMIPEREHSFFVSRFGMLGGLEGLNAPHRLEFLPYTTAQMQDNLVMQKDFTKNLGLDIKYGPSSNSTVDLTINPEFGTVETDEEQLNLSPFPTYYPEKRPFFLEFQDIFRTDIRLVHTRRIGRPLGNVVNPSATILSGARIVGKTQNGLRYGLVEALVDEERYYYLDENLSGEFDSGDEEAFRKMNDIPLEQRPEAVESYLEPRTNYFIGRLIKEYNNQSSIGLIAAAVNRELEGKSYDGSPYAYTGGIDWDFRIHNNTWRFSGQVVGSDVEYDGDKKEGYGMELKFDKFSSEHLTYGVDYDHYSSDLDINDLGWNYGNTYGTHRLRTDIRLQARPHKRGIRSFNFSWELNRNWTDSGLETLYGKTLGNRFETMMGLYDGEELSSAGGSFSGWFSFMNYWSIYFGLRRAFDSSEDPYRAAEDYNFIFAYPKSFSYWYGISNDYHSRFRISINQQGGSFRDGSSWSGSLSLSFRPSPNLELQFQPRFQRNWDFSDFSDPVVVEGRDTPEKILTLRKTRFESFVFRTSYTMSTRLDFRLFAQYTDFQSNRYQPLVNDGFEIELPVDTRSTLGLHFVTRFEYKPGSYFYLVYRENRFDEADGAGFGRPDRQIIGKFTYWLKSG
ncbi:MAG TPA: DUF5916 domain-containing protein [archaeon]|nr:DUF5916 domain-containing protein [archaeon]